MVKLKVRLKIRQRIRLVACFFILFFLIVIGRAYFLQIYKPDELRKRIEKKNKGKIALTPLRGTIYDRNGTELAVSIDVDSLFARPHLIKNPKETAKKVAAVIKIPRKKILQKVTALKNFIWIKRKLTPSQVEKIKSLNIDGLGFVKETKRFYPNRELAAQLIGFAGVDNQGLEGIEREYEDILKGTQRYLPVDMDALGRYLYIEGMNPSGDFHGNDVYLTIDKNIQYIAEKELKRAVSLSKAKGGIAVVMDPWTGEVLALAVAPLFNPNQYGSYKPEIWKNRAVTDVFEPGSTFKTFLVASALEEGLIKQSDIFFCENGSYRVSNKTIHDLHPHGWLTVTKILKYSSNIGASKISKYLGKEVFYQYIRNFGFREKTGVMYPIEAPGYVPLPYNLSDHTQSAIGFGQGISVTALQLANAYCTIANGGVLLRPHFLKKISDTRGMTIQETKPTKQRSVISNKTASIVNEILKNVISKGGTGAKAAIPGFTVAGKTGTSQKIDKKSKGYSDKNVIASFVGFVPADSPKVTILVIVDEPQKMAYGGEIAAPAFSRMGRRILHYLHVTPDALPRSTYEGWKETKRKDALTGHQG